MVQDLRYSFRELRKRPGLAVTAILSLTLGIGATTAVFSVIHGLLSNTYPYKDADRMIHLVLKNEKGQDDWPGITGSQLKALREVKAIASVAASWGVWNLTTTGEELPQDVPSLQLTGNAGIHFGVPALYGRTLLPSDAPDGQDPQPVVVLSYLFWQRHFNSDPSVVGRNLQLIHKNYTIVGILPPRFTWEDADVYLPLKITNDPTMQYGPLIRLKPGITHEAANAELLPVLQQFAKEFPGRYPKQFRVAVKGLNDQFIERVGPSLYLLFGAVALLLMVGCANVSILLLARGTARQHELSIRAAIGASRWQIQKQLLTEALTLSLTGALGGIVFAYALLPVLIRWLPERAIPHEASIRINVAVLAFSVAVGIITGVVSGLAPALQFSRPEVAQLIQSTSRRATGGARGKRTYQILVAGQIALTVLLLTSAGAAVNGFLSLVQTNLGYDPHNTISVGIPIHENTHVNWADRSQYFAQIFSRIAAMPDVTAAGISTNATPPSNGNDMRVEPFGTQVSENERANVNFISSGYFPVLRIPLQQGRLWSETEIAKAAKLAVINQSMAQRYWPKGDAIGKLLRVPGIKEYLPLSPAAEGSNGWLQIIGIVAGARNDGLRKPIKPAVYVPYTMQMQMFTQILVRSQGNPLAILNQVRAEVKQVDPDQQVFGNTRDLDHWIQRETEYAYGRLIAGLFSAFSLLALSLAAIGLFSVVSYSVAQRTNEFGIRLALGASPMQVVQLLLHSTVWNVAAGLVAGGALSLISSGLLHKWAEGSAHTPLMIVAVAALLLTTAALATLLPARRAFAVDPMIALRYE